ncbi:MAG: hypothetical protein LBM75_00990 [Myxococcales bacterium]|nr:hypothetical protein [Myxococcales bacterium]
MNAVLPLLRAVSLIGKAHQLHGHGQAALGNGVVVLHCLARWQPRICQTVRLTSGAAILST